MIAPRVEIQPDTGGFIIGRSVIGDRLDIPDTSLDWINIFTVSTGITITRKRTDTGTLTLGIGDRGRVAMLEKSTLATPNRPIRVVNTLDDIELGKLHWPLTNSAIPQNEGRFTYVVWNGLEGKNWEWVPETGRLRRYTGPSFSNQAFDAQTTVYPTDGQTFKAVFEFTPSVTLNHSVWFYNAAGVSVGKPAQWTIGGQKTTYAAGETHRLEIIGDTPAAPISIRPFMSFSSAFTVDFSEWSISWYGPTTEPIFTGVIQDLQGTWERDNYFATVACVDATASLANTTRYGAIAPGGYETWPARIARLATSAKVPVVIPTSENAIRTIAIRLDAWNRWGTLPAGTSPEPLTDWENILTWSNKKTGPVNHVGYAYGVETILDDLTLGSTYEISIRVRTATAIATIYALGIDGLGYGRPFTPNTDFQTIRYTFTATADTHTLRFTPTETHAWGDGGWFMSNLELTELRLTEKADSYRLRSIAYEGALAEHLTVACDSIGASWGTGRDGKVRFTRGPGDIKATFTDQTPTSETPTIGYTMLEIGYDTANVVNTLDVSNIGRDDEGLVIEDTTTHTSPQSVATIGARRGTITTSLYDEAEFTGSVTKRANAYLAQSSGLDRRPTSLSFRGLDHPETTYTLDLNDVVQIIRNDETYLCLVDGITHSIQPAIGKLPAYSHLVTLDLERLP